MTVQLYWALMGFSLACSCLSVLAPKGLGALLLVLASAAISSAGTGLAIGLQ